MRGSWRLGAGFCASRAGAGRGDSRPSASQRRHSKRAVPRLERLENRELLASDLIISELVATGSSFRDSEQEAYDWIEIHNPTDAPVDLSGWSLTDDADDLTKWKFPLMQIAPGGYEVVFASDRDRAETSARLTRDFHAVENATFLVNLEEGTYHVLVILADAGKARDQMILSIQGQQRDVLTAAAGEIITKTYRAEVGPADGGRLALQLQDTGGETNRAVINALVITPVGAGSPLWFDFGTADSPLEPGFTRVTMADVYSENVDFGWQAGNNGAEQDRGGEQADLHANFKLASEGEYLALVRPDGSTVAYQYAPQYAPQYVGASYGLEQTDPGSAAPRYFAPPTPGLPNGDVSFAGMVTVPPSVSVAGGLFDAPFDVLVTTDLPGVTLVVTLDGSRPTLDGGRQSRAPDPQTPPPPITIAIARTTVLRTAVLKADYLPSVVENRTYIFPGDVGSQDYQATIDAGFPPTWAGFSADYGLDPDVVGPNDLFGGVFAEQLPDVLRAIPSFSIVTDMENLFGPTGIHENPSPTQTGFEWERPTSVELILPDGSTAFRLDAGLRIAGDNVRYHGNSLKKSFRLAFRSEYGAAKLEYPLFGDDAADSFDTINLRGNYNDGWVHTPDTSQHIRDEWLRRTVLEMGQVTSHGRFVHLYINGFYWGVYDAVERPDASFLATYFGGDKGEWDALNTGQVINGTRTAWEDLLDQAVAVTAATDQQASNAAYQHLLGNNPDGTDNPDAETLLDVENYIDYMIANYYGGNTDWPGRNWRVGRQQGPESTGFKFFVWDAEKILNHGEGSDLYVNRTNQGSGVARLYWQLRQNEEFLLLFADHVHRHFFNGGVFYVDPENPAWDPAHPERNVPAARYDELANEYEVPVIGEMARWGDTVRPWLGIGVHDGLYTIDDWRAFRDGLFTTYFPQRSAIVLDHFRRAGLYPEVAAPVFNRHGGDIERGFELTMAGPGALYYTLDGSDPRQSAFGGGPGVADTAILWDGAIPLTGSTVVKARALVDGAWSALNEAHFVVGAPPLRISEVMYHPHDPETGVPYDDDDDFEFIELVNASSAASIDLEDVAFTRGVQFTFPAMTLAPGQHVVVVRNQAAFASRYGTGVLVAGQYGGTPDDFKLDNAGETIRLEDATGGLIQEFTYNDSWHPTTDGAGYALEAIDPAQADVGQFNRADAWLPSIAFGGTPGAARSTATVPAGDANLDGQVDAGDVGAFVLGLASPTSYQARYGVPASLAGDMDGDGDLDFDDIDDFVGQIAEATAAGRAGTLAQMTCVPPAAPADGTGPRDDVPRADAVSSTTSGRVRLSTRQVGASAARSGRADRLWARQRTLPRASQDSRLQGVWTTVADQSLAAETDWLR